MIERDADRVGLELADGRYKVLGRIGTGSMGHVYRAYDHNLETEVVIKFPITSDTSLEGADLIERFGREVRSLVRLSHPHIVKIIDVGEDGGSPYVVLQYLSGGTLKDRLLGGPAGEPRPLPPESLHDWLPDVARALDFIHTQGHIHRDVKPANILFDGHGHAFLGDFGIIKALTGAEKGEAWKDNSLTAPGFLMGTPGYVAPEIVMGSAPDARSDQYALGMMIHEILTGHNLMAGPSPSATIVNQTKVELPLLGELVPRIPRRLSEAVRRALAKEPDDRYPTCAAFAQEVLAELPSEAPPEATETDTRIIPGMALCPRCRWPVTVGGAGSGERVRCGRCATESVVGLKAGRPTLAAVAPADPGSSSSQMGWGQPGNGPTRSTPLPAGRGRPVDRPATAPARVRRIAIGAIGLGLLGLMVGSVGYFAVKLFWSSPPVDVIHHLAAKPSGEGEGEGPLDAGAGLPPGSIRPIEINVVYGTEKRKWFQSAVREFAKTPAGRQIKVNLIGQGSVEGARTILTMSKTTPVHVWSPASGAYRDLFVQEWSVRHGGKPILRAQDLALTPMVFVLWRPRYEAFLKKYGKVTFKTLSEAMHEPGGWGTIAGKPEWGLFKFGHSDPNESNSGMLGLVLLAYEFAGKERNLTLSDVTRPEFQAFFRDFERGITRHGGSLTHSTGTLMVEMIKRGPSQYDGLLLYENLAIEYMKDAREHWGAEGQLEVIYPERNIWNDHPYYILDVPWSRPEERGAAAEFLEFLLSEPIQRMALAEGFRPGNPTVPVRSAESPLVENEKYGVKIGVDFKLCEPPKADVLSSLLSSSQRLGR